MTKKELERMRDNVIGWLSLVGWILIISWGLALIARYG
jgi:hypothetical protein